MVRRVKASPAREPNGLEPPTPPKAPARPPPLPRWIKTRRMRNSPLRRMKTFKKLARNGHIAHAFHSKPGWFMEIIETRTCQEKTTLGGFLAGNLLLLLVLLLVLFFLHLET